MKVSIITAITGGFDELKNIPDQSVPFNVQKYSEKDVPIPFTVHRYSDNDVPEEYKHLNNRTRALYFKQQMHNYLPDTDVYIWIDGKVQVLSSDFIKQCLKALIENDLAILRHGSRQSCREEVDYIQSRIAVGDKYLTTRYAHRDLISQLKRMTDAGYPDDRGLFDCSIIAVRNTPAAAKVFNYWWKLCQDEIWFDQIAIQFASWINGINISPINLMPGSFKLVKHLK